MRCQVCGFTVTNPDVLFCPNCGSTLPRAAAPDAEQPLPAGPAQAPVLPPAAMPGMAAGMAPGMAPDMPPGMPQANPSLGGPAPETVPGPVPGPVPGMPPGYPPSYPPPPAGWPVPPGYPAAYGPPTMPPGASFPGYGQPAAPSMPYGAPPGYPFAAPATVPFGAPYPGYPMGTPPAPPRKRRTGLIVGISLATVLVVLAATAAGLYAFVPQVRTLFPGGASANATPTVAAGPTATATPSEAILYQNTFASEAANWSNGAQCFLGTDGYHVKQGYICNAPVGNQINVDVKVDVKQLSGPTNQPYGIALRITRTPFSDYQFNLDALGHWVFFKCNANTCDNLSDFSAAASIRGGLNVSNTLEVNANGSHFDFFVNGSKVGQIDDSTYPSGLVGLVGAYQGECVFTNLTIAQPN